MKVHRDCVKPQSHWWPDGAGNEKPNQLPISYVHISIMLSCLQKFWPGRRRRDGVVEPVHLQPQEHHPVQGQLARRVHARRATTGKMPILPEREFLKPQQW